jgi:glycosyltransferase involved in cell wall biosynthesis
MLERLFAEPIPDCRLAFWCHKNYPFTPQVASYPDRFIVTSPVIGEQYPCIWSTGNMNRFLALQPKAHEGFNIGTVCSPKLHPQWFEMCQQIKKVIPEARFTVLGDYYKNEGNFGLQNQFTFTGKVDDVAPYLAEMDVFGYPLREDHYGTCEIALGEAMAAGVVPVVMENPAERMIIQDGINGFIARGEGDYAWLVEFLYKKHETRKSMAVTTRLYARERYCINTMIDHWHRTFESMMTGPKTKKGGLLL